MITSPPRARPLASSLVQVDRDDEDQTDHHKLEERLHVQNHEAVRHHHRDKGPQNGPADRSDPAEEARPTEHDGSNRLEVVRLVADHVRARISGEIDHGGQADEHAHEHEQPEHVGVDADAGPDRGLTLGTDRQGPDAESRLAHRPPQDAADDKRQEQRDRDEAEQSIAAEVRLELIRQKRDVGRAREDQRDAVVDARRRERRDERVEAQPGDEQAVDEAEQGPRSDRDGDPCGDGWNEVRVVPGRDLLERPADGNHGLRGQDRRQLRAGGLPRR